MKSIFYLFIVILGLLSCGGCQSSGEKNVNSNNRNDFKTSAEMAKITVLYFHNKQPCATCMAVEEVSNEVIAPMDSSKIVFIDYAIGLKGTELLEKRFEIAGPTLLIVNKEKVINLTNSAYLFARIQPEKFKADLTMAIKDIQ